MSIPDFSEESNNSKKWLVYRDKIVLGIGILFIAAAAFEAGYLQGKQNKSDAVIVNKVAGCEISKECQPDIPTDGNLNNSSPSADKLTVEGNNPSATENQKCAFVASKNSNKYHLSNCRYAANIKPENKVCFSSKEEAESRGFQAAKCCIK